MHVLKFSAVLIYIFLLAACQQSPIAVRCVQDKQGTSSQCDCAAKAVKNSLPPNLFDIIEAFAQNKSTEAQQLMNKLGFGEKLVATQQISQAQKLANQQCNTQLQ